MSRVLTGIQSTGVPHLGNILGAIKPSIELSKTSEIESLFFIADLHSITTIRSAEVIKENTYAVAAAWLAFGFDTDKNIFYRQSDIPNVCELAWYLNCFTPIPMLENAHSYKDKLEKIGNGNKSKINSGLFTYPILMAADILLYDADIVPVGKDQKQHLEITRDIANSFNHQLGETFIVPSPHIKKEVMIVPGTDGKKMSKSYNNFIDIFQTDKKLRKNIMKIETDSTALEEPKDPSTCNVFKLYSLLATREQTQEMKENYLKGNYGYGHAKQALFELICDCYNEERQLFSKLLQDKSYLDEELKKGAEKAKIIANQVLERVRQKLGFSVG